MGFFRKNLLKLTTPLLRLPIVGLDISDRTMKYLKLGFGRRVSFDAFGEIDIPEGVIDGGEIKKEAALTEIINQWSNTMPKSFNASLIAASLPEEKSFVRVIQLPKIKREDIGNAIRWEIETNIPLPPENLVYDYEIIEPLTNHLDHLDVVIVAFPKDIVNSYAAVLRNAGLKPAVLELESQAIVRAVVSDLKERESKIIVDIGKNRTSLINFVGGSITFTYTIQLGGTALEDNIARSLNVSREEAKTIKENIGLDKSVKNERVYSALIPAVSALADEVQRMKDNYQKHTEHSHGASPTIDKIILVGGDANLFGLDTLLASTLKVPIVFGDPTINIKNRIDASVPPLPRNQALAFATTIGLALRGS